MILGSSGLVTTFDPASRTLRIDKLAIAPSAPFVNFGPKTTICFGEMTFHLPEASPPPQAAVDSEGRFALRFPVVLSYVASTSVLFCIPAPGSLTVTWDVTGTFSVDPTSGRTRLGDVTVTISDSSERRILDTGTLVLNLWDGFGLVEAPKVQRVGDAIELLGSDITPGTILKVYVNTPHGVLDAIPDGLAPTATTPTSWKGVLPFPWPVPAPDDIELGLGFMQAVLVRTDRGFDRSNGVSRVLTGNVDLGVPSILNIGPTEGGQLGPTELADSSWSPKVAVANIENVLVPGRSYSLGASNPLAKIFSGQDPVVNVFAAGGNCAPPGGVVPTSRGDNFIGITLPASCPTGPGALQVVNRHNGVASNIVSVPLGSLIRFDAVVVQGRTVEVTGVGFSTLTVLNVFATRQGTGEVTNFGGLASDGAPSIPLTSVTPTRLTFELPSDAAAGPAFIEALNPPFIPFTSSLIRSIGDAFTIP